MTIIGFEIRDNGHANLLVFDPMFKTSPAMQRLIGTSAQSNNPSRLLKAYRRGASYLQKYKIFELLKWVFYLYVCLMYLADFGKKEFPQTGYVLVMLFPRASP